MKDKLLSWLHFAYHIVFIILFILGIVEIIYSIIDSIKYIIVTTIDIVHDFNLVTFIIILVTLAFTSLLIYIVFNWERRDYFFLFIASMLSSPSDYLYKVRKKQLIKYRDEIAELISSIKYFSKIDETISSTDFWLFVNNVSNQKERLEKNRIFLEKKNNRINWWIQIFFLICGVIISLS